MPIDPTKLSQTELLHLVNGTPLGAVLTRARLRRQMDAASTRIANADAPGRIHLVKYVRWLVLEYERPKAGPMDYGEAKRRQAQRNRAATKAAQDIGPIPDVQDMKRRRATCRSLRKFCETYFAAMFFYPWSKDHLRTLRKLERAIRSGGLFLDAMPRGSGKTCLLVVGALWAILGGFHPFVCVIGSTERRGKKLLTVIKKAILENDLLLADFPEAIYALRRLENSSKRQLQQHIGGKLTHVRWEDMEIVFPTVAHEDLPESLRVKSAEIPTVLGAVIAVTSLDANLRGPVHPRADGSMIRPSLALLDDPQTRQSARSPSQTKFRLQLLSGDVLGMAGPGQPMAALVAGTKIYADDLVDQLGDRKKYPEWISETTKLVYAFPTNSKLWDQYAELRADGLARGDEGAAGTEFYRRHRKRMDMGAVVAWPQRYDHKRELSAIQHAMNLKLRDEEAFFAEYQNEPMREQIGDDVVTVQQLQEKINGRRRGTVPLACTILTMFVDVQDRLLYYCLAAWEESFTGYIIDYGTFPAQRVRWFAMRSARHTLRRQFPGRGEDGAIEAGLEALVGDYLQREWQRTGGGVLRINRQLVDMGYKGGIVADVKHKVGGATMMLSRGFGIGANRRPMSQYRRKPGARLGHHWYMPNVKGTAEFPHVVIDTNYWKGFVHRALATPAGEVGSLSIYGKKPAAHELFAEHIANSETWVETQGYGRTVREWRQRPSRPDNHWLDCLVGCAAAACMEGATTADMVAGRRQTRTRKRYTQADLKRRTG